MKLRDYLFIILLSTSMTTITYLFLKNLLTRIVKKESMKIEDRILDDYTFRKWEDEDDDEINFDLKSTNTLINKEGIFFNKEHLLYL